jgi:hypothetical protein
MSGREAFCETLKGLNVEVGGLKSLIAFHLHTSYTFFNYARLLFGTDLLYRLP